MTLKRGRTVSSQPENALREQLKAGDMAGLILVVGGVLLIVLVR